VHGDFKLTFIVMVCTWSSFCLTTIVSLLQMHYDNTINKERGNGNPQMSDEILTTQSYRTELWYLKHSKFFWNTQWTFCFTHNTQIISVNTWKNFKNEVTYQYRLSNTT